MALEQGDKIDRYSIIAHLGAGGMGVVYRAYDPRLERHVDVLVLGETGVGKEVLARTLHARSPRSAAAMVSINCAAIAESVLESELFGHEKGAFTGAQQVKVGLLESADGGTVLDEVGEMSASVQRRCCASSSSVRSCGSARCGPVRSTCGSSPRPIAIWTPRWRPVGFAPICTIGSTV